MSGATTSHKGSMGAAEKPGNPPLPKDRRDFNRHWKSVQLSGCRWGKAQFDKNKYIHDAENTVKNCWIKKDTTPLRPRKEKRQMAESTAGIRCEVGKHRRCQQDVLKGLWGISVKAQKLQAPGDGGRDRVAEAVIHHGPIFLCPLERVREQI